MSFEPAVTKRQVSIPKITISLIEAPQIDPDSQQETITQSISYSLAVRYDDGSEVPRHGDLAPYLTHQQIAGLQAFMSDMRILAETSILPS